MIISPAPPKGEIKYPESDGKPMAETPVLIEALIALRFAFMTHFRERDDVYVGANMFLYYLEGDSREVVAPDMFVALGVPKRARRTYKVWEEGRGPTVVFEITSDSTRREDLHTKRGLYEELGVREYFLFDPLADYLKTQLKGYRLVQNSYVPMDGEILKSDALGLEFRADGEHVRVRDPLRGIDYLYPDEEETARQVAEERVLQEQLRADHAARQAEQAAARAAHETARAAQEAARADHATARAEQEAAARRMAEEQVTRLRAELEKLRGAPS